jgi:hypothetical protein
MNGYAIPEIQGDCRFRTMMGDLQLPTGGTEQDVVRTNCKMLLSLNLLPGRGMR